MENMNATPMASRFAIGLFGKRNAGKSSLINAITGQDIAITSDVPGTTTDPVYKAMELLPIGPVVLIDTAGLDDVDGLGALRVEKTYEVLRKCNLAIVAVDVQLGISEFEAEFIEQLKRRKVPSVCVLNKCDKGVLDAGELEKLKELAGIPLICASTINGFGIDEIKKQIVANSGFEDAEPALVSDLIHAGDIAVLVTPIDKSAPKGRLILPQQQTIRDIIESDAMVIVTKEHELKLTLERLKTPPAIVITDSQAFLKVSADTPPGIPMTSFSILFARQKADLAEMVRGVRRIEKLAPGDKVLIVEGCTHHRQSDDIGKVKIPRWIRQIAGGGIEFEWASGACFPKDISGYAVIIHCGGCMLNRREMQYRVQKARERSTSVTNYGILIAYVMGILPRALRPFPPANLALEEVEPIK
ncbi:[FeFe]-hydrogenase maturation GTPase HydF [Dehalobacter sp. UNSWDHB]|jgi:small GTP-binding protein domain|uniref:[FeFe] hydrogenase H-cluster maturation GTPase HydF n=1 Tax=unclassified Dehalobacter TaxID=2635733 RepID=UPI00028A7C69|nr:MULTISPECIES: [FeFe] hydrogenase H-cluster maturation GTPase HydF [unclassified Dehalobacter]AFV02801.1 Putative GTP-binding protein [Dehalobacter sp. DCA]AFV05786.1 Putative GTP-binding protein [Dehalobacter sp. CF]EQB20517.1 [FeFe]-hydrogenase maturation GTPase HydF [Dehalobacter sp. UNSWDHB]